MITEVRKAYLKAWRAANPEKVKENRKRWEAANPEARKAWRLANPERAAATDKAWRIANPGRKEELNKAWKLANPGRKEELNKAWSKENPHKVNAKSSRNRAAKLQATPLWANESEILKVYELAQYKTKETGIVHHVDHRVPLRSKLVCGLHCGSNLRVIPGKENLSKSNKHWPDMPDNKP